MAWSKDDKQWLAGTGGSVMREIARIIASNTARIDLSMWLRSEP